MNTDKSFNNSMGYLVLATVTLLMIPLIAMQFTNEVTWTLTDFIFAAMLILGTGLTYILITRKNKDNSYRIAVGFALFSGLFLIWSNLAVGIVGSEDNDFNLLYFLVIGAGIIGAFYSNFKARGLMITLLSMAGFQLFITITALLTGMHEISGSTVYEILAVNSFFIVLFTVSALLFRNILKQ